MTSPSFVLQRVLAAAGLVVAFVFMASVFSPSDTRAGQNAVPIARIPAGAAQNVGAPKSTRSPSTDAHAGLASLGEIQTNAYVVRIYSTDLGPRYTILDSDDSSELATLMSAADVAQFFPELPLSEIDFGTSGRSDGESASINHGPLMMADTPGIDH
jgi:hypothetical protein